LLTFNGSSGDEATFQPDGEPANANISAISRGSGLVPVTAAGAFNSRSWTTASGPYYSFTITPNPGAPIALTELDFDGLRTATGPTNLALRSSLDGFAADLATFSLATPDSLAHFTAALGGPFQNLTNAVEFRIYASNAADANGALAIDNVELFGDFNQGTMTILNDDCIAPSITQQPSAATRCEGQSVTFSVSASGVAPLTYQWLLDGGDIVGATNSSLTIAAVTGADVGSYTVAVNNPCGSATSDPAVLTVNTSTTASGPSGLIRCAGQSASFSVTASGTGPFSYQWTKGGTPITGANGDTFSIASVSGADTGTYCVVVTGACNIVTNCASLTVNLSTTASALSNVTRCPGQGASFSTTASGTGPFTYQWLKDGVDISGATDPTYTIPSVAATDGGTYCVIVTGTCNSITNCAALTVNEPTSAIGPADLTVCPGSVASFSTIASGTGLFSYQWSKDGVDISGATNANYSIAAVGATNAGAYCVVVSGTCNSVTNCATLTLDTPTTASGPSDLSLCPGQGASFSTTASGTGPFTYQWRKANVDISGATNSSYTIASVTATDAGTYCVVVSGACNGVTNCATLTVNTPTTATGPSDLTVSQGANANFTTTANGTAP